MLTQQSRFRVIKTSHTRSQTHGSESPCEQCMSRFSVQSVLTGTRKARYRLPPHRLTALPVTQSRNQPTQHRTSHQAVLHLDLRWETDGGLRHCEWRQQRQRLASTRSVLLEELRPVRSQGSAPRASRSNGVGNAQYDSLFPEEKK
jgi:hypothetical protein